MGNMKDTLASVRRAFWGWGSSPHASQANTEADLPRSRRFMPPQSRMDPAERWRQYQQRINHRPVLHPLHIPGNACPQTHSPRRVGYPLPSRSRRRRRTPGNGRPDSHRTWCPPQYRVREPGASRCGHGRGAAPPGNASVRHPKKCLRHACMHATARTSSTNPCLR